MARTSGELLVNRLAAWGVDTVFGLPGDGINGLIEALRKEQERIRFVHVRHEESAAFVACGYAKFSGGWACAWPPPGPGPSHLLNGLHDAKLDGVLALALTGMTYHDLIGTRYQQDVNTHHRTHRPLSSRLRPPGDGLGVWGAELRELMFDYNHYSGWGLVGECLPADENRGFSIPTIETAMTARWRG